MTKLTLIERRLRITTGLILAIYIVVHLSNHTLGLVSLEAMESMRKFVTPFWRSWVGGLLIYTSLLTHFGLARPVDCPTARGPCSSDLGCTGINGFRH